MVAEFRPMHGVNLWVRCATKVQDLVLMIRDKASKRILVKSPAFARRENSRFGVLWECGQVQQRLYADVKYTKR